MRGHYKGKLNPRNLEGTLIIVKDNGMGIKVNELPRIFERYFRSLEVNEINVSGLELSITKNLILLHQGEIFLDSEFGKGTTVSIFFPNEL